MHGHSIRVDGFGAVDLSFNGDWSGEVRVGWGRIVDGWREHEVSIPGSFLCALVEADVLRHLKRSVKLFFSGGRRGLPAKCAPVRGGWYAIPEYGKVSLIFRGFSDRVALVSFRDAYYGRRKKSAEIPERLLSAIAVHAAAEKLRSEAIAFLEEWPAKS